MIRKFSTGLERKEKNMDEIEREVSPEAKTGEDEIEPASEVEKGRAGEVGAMLDAGLGVPEIANEMGYSIPYIYKIMKAHGLRAKKKPARAGVAMMLSDEQKKDVVKLYVGRSMPAVEIISAYGLNWMAFYKLLREEGVVLTEVKEDGRQLKQMRMDIAVQMYMEGAPYWRIKQETGIHQPQLTAELHVRGVELKRVERARRKGQMSDEELRKLGRRADDTELQPDFIACDPNP